MRHALILAAAMLMVAADRPDHALDDAIAGRVAQKPESCVDIASVNGPEIIDNQTIIYRSASRVWVNRLPEACPSLHDDVLVITDVYGAQMCHNDRFRTLTRNTTIPSGYCRLGDFTPYVKPKPAKKS